MNFKKHPKIYNMKFTVIFLYGLSHYLGTSVNLNKRINKRMITGGCPHRLVHQKWTKMPPPPMAHRQEISTLEK